MLPSDFPNWKMVYHHFRTWCDKEFFSGLLPILVGAKRAYIGDSPDAEVGIIDSQSVRSALPHSSKGIDGHKRIKGIKRHVMVDTNGYVLGVDVSTANIHDSKGAYTLIINTLENHASINLIKADKGYSGRLGELLEDYLGVTLECVKSNFGTSDFIPMHGRWVVERTFSWMENYRRLTRNYEQKLRTARHMFIATAVLFMLRYFR
jgi:putative transposase